MNDNSIFLNKVLNYSNCDILHICATSLRGENICVSKVLDFMEVIESIYTKSDERLSRGRCVCEKGIIAYI